MKFLLWMIPIIFGAIGTFLNEIFDYEIIRLIIIILFGIPIYILWENILDREKNK